MPEKRDLVAQNKKIEFVMLMGRFNPPHVVLKYQRTKPCTRGGPAGPTYVPYSSQAIDERMLISTTSGVINISVYLTMYSVYAIPVSSHF